MTNLQNRYLLAPALGHGNQIPRIVGCGTALSFLPSAVLFFVFVKIGFIDFPHNISFSDPAWREDMVNGVLSAWFETALMAPLFWIFNKIKIRGELLLICSATIWALSHARLSPYKAFLVIIPFYVFSYVFTTVKEISINRAYIVTSIIHMTHNLFCSLLYLFV